MAAAEPQQEAPKKLRFPTAFTVLAAVLPFLLAAFLVCCAFVGNLRSDVVKGD